MSAFYEIQMYCSPHHSKGHEKRDKFSGGNFFKFEPSYPQEIITSIVSKIQNFLCKSEHEKGKNYTFRFRDTSCVTIRHRTTGAICTLIIIYCDISCYNERENMRKLIDSDANAVTKVFSTLIKR